MPSSKSSFRHVIRDRKSSPEIIIVSNENTVFLNPKHLAWKITGMTEITMSITASTGTMENIGFSSGTATVATSDVPIALEFGAVLFYSTLSATDQKSISLERAFQAMREDGAVSGTAVLTDIDPGCRAELNGFKPYLDTRIEVFNGQNGQKNVLAEAGKALSSGNLSAICDDYGMDYAVLNYGINDVGIQDLKESGFKPVYSDNLTVCLKRSTV